MKDELKDSVHFMLHPESKGPRIWSVTMDDPDDTATAENDIEPDTYWATLKLAEEHARRVLARLPKADVCVVECVIRNAPMSDKEYTEHRHQ